MKWQIQSDFTKKVFILFSGTSFAQAIPILISPILTRIYSPEEFGTFGLYTAMVALLSVLATGRFEVAILLPKRNIDAVQLTFLSIFLSVLVSITFYFILIFSGETVSKWMNNSGFNNIVLLVPLGVLANGFIQALGYWTNRIDKFKLIAYSRIGRSSGSGILQIAMGILGQGTLGLVVGQLLGATIESFILVRKFNFFKKINSISLERVKSLIIKYQNFPKYDVLGALLNSSSLALQIVFFNKYFTIQEAGFFFQSYKVLTIPVVILGSAIAQVFVQKASYSNSTNELTLLVEKIFDTLLKVGAVILIPLIFGGEQIFILVFGQEWATSGIYAEWISIWLLVQFISSPLSQVFQVLDKQYILLRFSIILFISRLGSLLYGTFILQSATFTVIILSFANALIYLVQLHYIYKTVSASHLKLYKGVLSVFLIVILLKVVLYFI